MPNTLGFTKKITHGLTIGLLILACKSDDALLEGGSQKPSDLGISYQIDDSLRLVLYNGEPFNFNATLTIGADIATIETDDITFQKGKAYSITYKGSRYTLYRTELPIISVSTEGVDIRNEPKVSGTLTLLEKGMSPFESGIGIELRGGVSRSFPKKSYSMELWRDPQGTDKFNEPLLGMRNDDDWILDGLWNEPLRLRDYVCHDLWLKIGRHPYKTQEPNSLMGINRVFCEFILNGSYRGVYYLGEKIDRKQLNLKEFDANLNGELYKGSDWKPGVTFDGQEDFTNTEDYWSGFEAKYPDEVGILDWSNLHDLIGFVVNSDQNTFDTGIAQRVDLPNMADYFIFMNMTYAEDNRGKNVYIARYDRSSLYFFLPWDMDGTFGSFWTGERIDITDGILSNGLYNKLLLNNDFKTEVKARWNTLKTNELGAAQLQRMFEINYNYLKDNGIYQREALNPELTQLYSEEEIDFLKDWIERRITYLDSYFSNL